MRGLIFSLFVNLLFLFSLGFAPTPAQASCLATGICLYGEQELGEDPSRVIRPTTTNQALPVKKSTSGLCHAPGSQYYEQTRNFTPYPTMEACQGGNSNPTVRTNTTQPPTRTENTLIPRQTQSVIKKSVNDICHAPGGASYTRTQNYQSYPSMEACVASGGRPARN